LPTGGEDGGFGFIVGSLVLGEVVGLKVGSAVGSGVGDCVGGHVSRQVVVNDGHKNGSNEATSEEIQTPLDVQYCPPLCVQRRQLSL